MNAEIIQKVNNFIFTKTVQKRTKNIYYIVVKGNMSGFFAILRAVLAYICYADKVGLVPYVYYDKDNLYYEKHFIQGSNNTFEYYFEQTFPSDKILLPWQLNISKPNVNHLNEIEQEYNGREFSYIVSDKYIDKMAYIYSKYIHLTTYTSQYIHSSAKRMLKGRNTLGVHMRGSDFNKAFNNHPVPVTVEEYASAIIHAVDQYKYEQIFLATDDERCMKGLKKIINIPIISYSDVARTDTDKSVAFSRRERKNDRYLLGLEILRDTYTLSYCNGFIGCLSQVDIFVQIIKKSSGKDFKYKKVIDKGIFLNEKECWEPRNI